jgi:hypothetical protein
MQIDRLGVPVGTVCLLSLVVACGESDARVLPQLEDAGGVEIATLRGMPEALDPDYLWSFRVHRQVATVRSPDESPLVFDPSQVLPLEDGRLLVYDPSADQPLVLMNPSTGTVIARFGRSGRGPSELGGWLSLAEVDGELIVLDSTNRQVHRFSSSGAPLSSTAVGSDGFVGKALPAPHGRAFLVEGSRSTDDGWYNVLEEIDVESGATTVLLRLPEPPDYAERGQIQRGRVVWTVLEEGILGMWTDRPTITVYAEDGPEVREIRLPLTRRHITEDDIQDQIDKYGAIASSLRPGPSSMTNELYAVNDSVFGMLISQIRRAAEDPDIPAGELWWRLLTARGEYLGVLRLPGDYQSFRILGRGNGMIWARALDDAGYPLIQELSLERADGVAIPSS